MVAGALGVTFALLICLFALRPELAVIPAAAIGLGVVWMGLRYTAASPDSLDLHAGIDRTVHRRLVSLRRRARGVALRHGCALLPAAASGGMAQSLLRARRLRALQLLLSVGGTDRALFIGAGFFRWPPAGFII